MAKAAHPTIRRRSAVIHMKGASTLSRPRTRASAKVKAVVSQESTIFREVDGRCSRGGAGRDSEPAGGTSEAGSNCPGVGSSPPWGDDSAPLSPCMRVESSPAVCRESSMAARSAACGSTDSSSRRLLRGAGGTASDGGGVAAVAFAESVSGGEFGSRFDDGAVPGSPDEDGAAAEESDTGSNSWTCRRISSTRSNWDSTSATPVGEGVSAATGGSMLAPTWCSMRWVRPVASSRSLWISDSEAICASPESEGGDASESLTVMSGIRRTAGIIGAKRWITSGASRNAADGGDRDSGERVAGGGGRRRR